MFDPRVSDQLTARRAILDLVLLIIGTQFAWALIDDGNDRSVGLFARIAAWNYVIYGASVVLHELGHALAAWAVGARVRGFYVGAGTPWRVRASSPEVIVRPWLTHGRVSVDLLDVAGYRLRMCALTAAGPLTNAVLLVLCVLLIDRSGVFALAIPTQAYMLFISLAGGRQYANDAWLIGHTARLTDDDVRQRVAGAWLRESALRDAAGDVQGALAALTAADRSGLYTTEIAVQRTVILLHHDRVRDAVLEIERLYPRVRADGSAPPDHLVIVLNLLAWSHAVAGTVSFETEMFAREALHRCAPDSPMLEPVADTLGAVLCERDPEQALTLLRTAGSPTPQAAGATRGFRALAYLALGHREAARTELAGVDPAVAGEAYRRAQRRLGEPTAVP